MTRNFARVALAVSLCAALWTERANAEPPYAPGPTVVATPGPGIPGPAVVPGKEYTPVGDMENPAGGGRGPDNLQILQWDGFGGAIDVQDFGENFEIDALANHADALFAAVVNNTAAMLLSSVGDPINPVMVESITGSVSTWATPAQVNSVGVSFPPASVSDLDALEVWGENFTSDADRFSLSNDINTGVSVWSWNGIAAAAYISQAEIAAVIGLTGPEADLVDLDALMVLEGGPVDDLTWNLGDAILFSIAPISGFYDGGEIWVYNFSQTLAVTLVHGGRIWNTANDVTSLLGSEDVDALEAVGGPEVPEPGSFVLLAVGGLGIAMLGRRRRQSANGNS